MYNYEQQADCIAAISGGTESVALLDWLLKNGRNPYCFHVSYNDADAGQNKAIKQIKQHYNIPITTYVYEVQANNRGVLDSKRTQEHYSEEPGQAGPMIAVWASIAHIIQVNNPWLGDIFYGACFGGLVEHGDTHGDYKSSYLQATYDKIEHLGKELGIKSKMSAPLGSHTKKELYEMIDPGIRHALWACVDPSTYKQCGECFKCKDLEKVKNAVDFS